MDEFLSLESKSVPINKQYISTTGISKLELSCIELSSDNSISPILTPQTKALVMYKALFTEKHIQALIWNIPIVYISYLYNHNSSLKAYELKAFQGATFSSSRVTDEIFINYFIQLGAVYEPNVSIYIDFLISDDEASEKSKFCSKYGIPIIKTSQVFSNQYNLFKKKIKYDAKQLHAKAIFFEKTFYIDPQLPQKLFNKIRRLIVENEGIRTSLIGENTDFIITQNYDNYKDNSSKIIHYQYIFDSVESKAVLHPEFYKFKYSSDQPVLSNCIAVVDKNIKNSIEYLNKLKSLGAVVKTKLDSRVTHYITENPNYNNIVSFHKSYDKLTPKSKEKATEEGFPFKIVTPEWIDQCLTALKHLKETRYSPGRPILSLKRRNSMRKEKEMLFQFTGLPSIFKSEAIKKFEKYGIKYSDSDKFENCTHLIMGNLNTSEKLFCSIVSGCWILKPDFIEDFQNEQNFDFEKYEWCIDETMNSKDKKIIDGIKKWRIKVQKDNIKPFSHWNVKIYASESKTESYKNLITYGGGTINDRIPFTHIFTDKDYQGEISETNYLNADAIFSYLFRQSTSNSK